jgi:hypothetical protein
MSTYIVTTEKQWKRKHPKVTKHVPKGQRTPYPYEQKSAHFQWTNPDWTLCHGYVHARPHAWVEFKGVVIDFAVPNTDPVLGKIHQTLETAKKQLAGAKMDEGHRIRAIEFLIQAQEEIKGSTFKEAFKEALRHIRRARNQKTIWEKDFEKFSHDKKNYYKEFKPVEVKKHDLNTTFQKLDYYGRYGNWEGKPSPFAGVI